MRTSVVMLAAAFIGALFPWLTVQVDSSTLDTLSDAHVGATKSFSVAGLLGWQVPALLVVAIGLAIVLHSTQPHRPQWLAVVAAGGAFVLATLSTVLMAVLWIGERVLHGLLGDVARLGASASIGLGFGGFLTTIASIALFVTTVRIACRPRPDTDAVGA